MRVRLTLVVPVLLALTAAAPAPSPPPAPIAPSSNVYRTPDDEEAFARNLWHIVNWVSDSYVRPVPRTELMHTALTALYEAAKKPTPRDLRRRIDRAEKEALARAPATTNEPPPIVPAMAVGRSPILDERPFLDLLRAVRADIGRVENVGGVDPLRICCQTMLRSLDPYSGVITANDEKRSLVIGTEREGYGLDVPDCENERAVLRDVLPGSPAQKAGLRPGDVVVRLHDSDGREQKLKESLDLLNSRAARLKPDLGVLAKPEPIRITYQRRGGGEKQVSVDWKHYHPESVFGVARRDDNSWDYWLDADKKIAQVRLGALADGTPDELGDILAQLRQDGLRGLILDLRWCPGGALVGSTRTAELFLGDGTVATVRYRNRPEEVFRSTKEDKHNDFPMMVLINGDSIGGAEMIAAALQDHQRAILVGQRTHGKGNVQNLQPIGSLGLKLTSGTLIRPNGKTLHRFPDSKPEDDWGVRPDPGHEYRISPDLTRSLRTWWEQQTMRPGSSTERLPLDDPQADPQRNAAWETLVGKLKN